MELASNQIEFLEKCEEARKIALSYKNPLIIHHYDCDGISSGAIAQNAFLKEKKKFRTMCIKKLDDEIIDKILKEKYVIFTDLGGGNNRVNELKDVLIIDHHQTKGVEKLQINPLLFGIDGGTELSAASTAYLVFRDLVDAAIVGATGDMQKPLIGMNRYVMEEGVKKGEIIVENDLCFYGRFSRPLLQFLIYSDDPYVSGVSYNEQGAEKLLLNLEIEKTSKNYADLSGGQKTKLISSLADILINNNQLEKAEHLIGESCVFPKRPRGGETYEANEFSTLLNACGRHGKPEIGVKVCIGDEASYIEAHSLLLYHRKMIRDGIEFGLKNVQDFGSYMFIDGRGKIDEGIIGIICGMVLSPLSKKPVIGVSLGENDMIKISSRGTKKLVENGLNLGLALKKITEEIGGIGGGHRIAAGASIPKDKINQFLVKMGEQVQSTK